MKWNPHQDLYGLFAEQAARTPHATAIVSDGRTMTYCEAATEARRIGRRLRAAGVGPEVIVGLYTSRSAETVCAVLGILAAGGAVCPLDPVLPAARLRVMLEDAAPVIVLGSDNLPEAEAELPPEVDGGNLAYVTFTSGSTGIPKAVANERRGVARLVEFTRDQMAIGPGDRILQFANLSFDASLWEIFCALCTGAALVLGDEESLMPGPGLHALLRDRRVTIALLSPSVLRVMRPEGLDDLRVVVAGTEKCGADIVRRWLPGRRFFNAYGPTESSIYCTIFEATESDVDAPPIGKAVPGTTVEAVDGELWIRGVGLARGYLNRPELTAARFVLFEDGLGRAYRTGDRGMLRPDGNFEYLGRLDTQLKVRGYRIEAGEVEAVLESHPEVAAAVAVAAVNEHGETVLWACWTPAASAAARAPAAALADYLRDRLPGYMVPQRFLQVDRWPLNVNGKLDRAVVEQWCREGHSPVTVAPRLSGEEFAWLLSRCRAILGNPELGDADDLSAAGFSSLAIAELLWSVQEEFGVTLGYAEVFAARHAAGIAELLCARTRPVADPRGEVVASQRADDCDSPVSAAQRRFYLLHQRDPSSPGYHIECHLDIRRPYDPHEVSAVLQGLVHRHELLRASFHDVGGKVLQRIHEAPLVDVCRFAPDETLDDIRSRFIRPFDLEQPPLMRAGVVVRSEHEFLLMLDLAHIVVDARSSEILIAEIRRALGGEPVDAPRRTYGDYVRWHNARLERNRHNHVAEYWRRELAGLPVPPPILPGRFRPTEDRGAIVVSDLGPARTARLKRIAAEAEVTYFSILAAMFGAFLGQVTGCSDVTFGTVLEGRQLAKHRDVVGPFVHLVPLRARPAAGKTFNQLSREVALCVQLALDHQDFDFDLLRQSGAPLYNAGFTLQHVHNPQNDVIYERDIRWPIDLNVEACDVDGSTQLRFILGRSLCGAGVSLAEMFRHIADRVAVEPSALLETLADVAATSTGRMAFAFDDEDAAP